MDEICHTGHHYTCTQAGPSFRVGYASHIPISPSTRGVQYPPASHKEEVRGEADTSGGISDGKTSPTRAPVGKWSQPALLALLLQG